MSQKDLNNAKIAKEDEFYTQLSDIEKELRHYRKHFEGKTVFCNCDDPFESNFFKYFVLNFNRLKLKKVIATCYTGSPIAYNQLTLADFDESLSESEKTGHQEKVPYKAIVTTVYDKTGNGEIGLDDVKELFKSGENTLAKLHGNGDYRSTECLELMDESDIVVTNPPFSLFQEYLTTLIERDKKFIIIGPQNALKYKGIFPYLKANKIWLGNNSGDMSFCVPDYYEPKQTRYWVDENGQKWRSMGNMCWFTNLDIKKRHEELILVRHYDPEKYPRYVNFDAIEVSKVADIPCDYAGNMGVPITFVTQYNPDQFEIIGMNWSVLENATLSDDIRQHHDVARRLNFYLPFPDGRGNAYTRMYDRVVIRNKHPEQPREVSE